MTVGGGLVTFVTPTTTTTTTNTTTTTATTTMTIWATLRVKIGPLLQPFTVGLIWET